MSEANGQRCEIPGEAWAVRHAAGVGALVTLGVWAASSMDRAAYHALYEPGIARSGVALAVKWMGTITPWLFIAGALMVFDAARERKRAGGAADWWRRGSMLLASGVAGGIVAEVLKIVFRRERPIYHEGLHMLRPITDRTLHSGGLDLPSSHVAVAFGVCCAWGWLFPRARAWAVGLATLVGVVRMLQGSHSLSGVLMGAAVGWSCARALRVIGRPAAGGGA